LLVPQDYVQARMYYNLSAGNGHAETHVEVSWQKMTPAQIEKTQELARN